MPWCRQFEVELSSRRLWQAAIAAVIIFGSLVRTHAQGTVLFSTRNTSASPPLALRVFSPEEPLLNDWAKYGNTATDLPAGTQTYTGDALTGSGWYAQLWAAAGADQPESALQPAMPITTFRTGTSAGAVAPVTVTLVGVPADCPVATLQMRVWSSVHTNWSRAYAYKQVGAGPAVGKSLRFNLANIGGGTNSVPLPYGLQSFSLAACLCETIDPPIIFEQPQNLRLSVGQNANLTALIGYWSGQFSYQWLRNSTNFSGWIASGGQVADAVLPFANAQANDAGVYSLQATNGFGASFSSNAVVTVGSPGSLTVELAGGQAVLRWEGAFPLQRATNITGPFLDVPGPVVFAPYTNIDFSSSGFFRLRN